jgi:hypothetical protein
VPATVIIPQAPAQAPTPPPIPALPSAPGRATGQGGGGAEAPTPSPADIARDAQTVANDALRAAQDAQNQAGGPARGPEDGLITSTGVPPIDPQAIIEASIPIVGMSLAMVVAIFVGWPLARAFARRMDRRTELGTVDAKQLVPQIRQLQESLDAMAVELERIGEAQRYQAKLLTERSSADSANRG